MTDWRQYQRTNLPEMAPCTKQLFVSLGLTKMSEMIPYVPGLLINSAVELGHVFISAADYLNGSPRVGDMIARNPENHEDQWLVAEKYFQENFVPVLASES